MAALEVVVVDYSRIHLFAVGLEVEVAKKHWLAEEACFDSFVDWARRIPLHCYYSVAVVSE